MAKKRPRSEDDTSEEYRLPIRVKVEHSAAPIQPNVATEQVQQHSKAVEAVQYNELSKEMTFSQCNMESDETAQMMQCDEILAENVKSKKRRKRSTPRGKRGKRRNKKLAATAAEAQEDDSLDALETMSSRNTEMITKPERPPIEGEGRRINLEYAEKIVQRNWGNGSNASLQDIIGPEFFAGGPERKIWTAIRALSGRTTLEKLAGCSDKLSLDLIDQKSQDINRPSGSCRRMCDTFTNCWT